MERLLSTDANVVLEETTRILATFAEAGIVPAVCDCGGVGYKQHISMCALVLAQRKEA